MLSRGKGLPYNKQAKMIMDDHIWPHTNTANFGPGAVKNTMTFSSFLPF